MKVYMSGISMREMRTDATVMHASLTTCDLRSWTDCRRHGSNVRNNCWKSAYSAAPASISARNSFICTTNNTTILKHTCTYCTVSLIITNKPSLQRPRNSGSSRSSKWVKYCQMREWDIQRLFSSPSQRWHLTACPSLLSFSQSRPSLNQSDHITTFITASYSHLLLLQYIICTPGVSVSHSMQYDVLNLMVPDIFSNKNNMS